MSVATILLLLAALLTCTNVISAKLTSEGEEHSPLVPPSGASNDRNLRAGVVLATREERVLDHELTGKFNGMVNKIALAKAGPDSRYRFKSFVRFEPLIQDLKNEGAAEALKVVYLKSTQEGEEQVKAQEMLEAAFSAFHAIKTPWSWIRALLLGSSGEEFATNVAMDYRKYVNERHQGD